MQKFFVKAITAKGQPIGYGVYDRVNGMDSQHASFMAPRDGDILVCLHLANTDRDDRNSGIAAEHSGPANHFRLNLAGRRAVKAARASA